MAEILNVKELDKLLKELDKAFKLPSIIDITPLEISRIQDDATRNNMERKFYLINELFIVPLEKLLNKCINSVNLKQGYTCDFSHYSLIQRMRLISKELLIYGYDSKSLSMLIPHTVEEVEERIKEIEARRSYKVVNIKNRNSIYRKSA